MIGPGPPVVNQEIWGVREASPGHHPCCQGPRAQSTGAIHGRNPQPGNGDVPAGAWPPRRNLMNRSILSYRLLNVGYPRLWCGRVTSEDLTEVRRESVRISNIKIILFVKLFFGSERNLHLELPRGPSTSPGPAPGYPGHICILNLAVINLFY